MIELSEIQARVLACLVEKERTTPEQYPLTVNSLRNACNQKSAREPVTSYTEGAVGHTLRELEALKLVREQWGARAPKFEHRLDKELGLFPKGIAILSTLMLRGPQTPGELRTHAQRLFEFEDLDDVQYELSRMASAEPPLVLPLPRQPGQKEGRYAHLLCGAPQLPLAAAPVAREIHGEGLEERVAQLEARYEALLERLERLEGD